VDDPKLKEGIDRCGGTLLLPPSDTTTSLFERLRITPSQYKEEGLIEALADPFLCILSLARLLFPFPSLLRE